MSAAPRKNLGPLLVLGIVVLIAGIAAGAWWFNRATNDDSQFAAHMNAGRGFYEAGDMPRAISAFQAGLAMNPANPDVHVNLANAFLQAGQPEQVLIHAGEALQVEPGSGAAHYLAGCAFLRLGSFSNAVQELQEAKQADPKINAVSFQLGRAYAGWGRFADAADQFTEVIEFERDHPSAHYQLGQMLLRQGAQADAEAALAEHQRISAGKPLTAADNPSVFEKCVYTEIRSPQSLEQPAATDVPVAFVDVTAQAFGAEASQLRGPLGVFDINRRGENDLLLPDAAGALRLLWNSNGVFAARTAPRPTTVGAVREIVVADLNNDRYDDALILGESGTELLRFATNAFITDGSGISGLKTTPGRALAVGDIDFTGKLAALIAGPDGQFRAFTNLGTAIFRERRRDAADPSLQVSGVSEIIIDDWNNDDLPDVLLTRPGQRPWVLTNRRREGLTGTNQPADWPPARALAVGDLNNDLRADVVLVTESALAIYFGGLKEPKRIPARKNGAQHTRLLDYDNDGWLDVMTWGTDGLRIWRNRGRRGFREMTAPLGLDAFVGREVLHIAHADFDSDGDTDFVLGLGDGVRLLRNDGANANGMVKLRPLGNRSNFSGIGLKVELNAGGWRAIRSVQRKPVEIGVGKHRDIETVVARWFDTQPLFGVTADPRAVIDLIEPRNPTGSCPYLYAWDGRQFRFVTDILSAAPLGLPMAPGRNIVADPEEFVALGDARTFQPRDGRFILQLTEELREVLYLDEARLVWTDVPADTEAHPTSKLMPGPPFPHHEVRHLRLPLPLRNAITSDGTDVTERLRAIDGQRVSPGLREPQRRGLAQPLGLVLDFGPLPDGPLTLALTGWLRFGGGMANVSGAHDPDLPFPFPVLEAGTADGRWQRVDIAIGAPAGKTKTILANLRLPRGTQRLRLSQAFEIHWDRIALFQENGPATITSLTLARTDLHWRGYGDFADLPATEPLTPEYARVRPSPPWRITPSGWATRYGPVDDLVRAADQGLALIAGGDELTLEFSATNLPPIPAGYRREFFLWTVGWDKDADFHVATGDRIEPLPWAGMDDQSIGRQERPAFASDVLHARHNTRWVGPLTPRRVEASRMGGPGPRQPARSGTTP
jgi:tetratricopeptide (TPR) repeat protein